MKFKIQMMLLLITISSLSTLVGMNQAKPMSLLSASSDIHKHIIKNIIDDTQVTYEKRNSIEIDACMDIRALSRTNKYFYQLINNSRNTHTIISQLALKFELLRLTAAIQLKTKGAKKWIHELACQDRSGETDHYLSSYLCAATENDDHLQISFLLSCMHSKS